MSRRSELLQDCVWDAGCECVECESPFVHYHHIFPGTARRKISDRYGYLIPLCPAHHTGATGIHFNMGMDLFWKETAQMHFEKWHGTRDDFIEIFGKSFIDEDRRKNESGDFDWAVDG